MPKLTLESLYDAHADAIHGFLLHITRDSEDTRDLLQATFVRLAKQTDGLEPIKRPRSYLFRTAHRLWLDLVRERKRRQQRHHRMEHEQPVFMEPTSGDLDLHQLLSHQLAQLPSEQRSVVHLRIWEDLSFSEIASLLEISKSTAVSRYRYALEN